MSASALYKLCTLVWNFEEDIAAMLSREAMGELCARVPWDDLTKCEPGSQESGITVYAQSDGHVCRVCRLSNRVLYDMTVIPEEGELVFSQSSGKFTFDHRYYRTSRPPWAAYRYAWILSSKYPRDVDVAARLSKVYPSNIDPARVRAGLGIVMSIMDPTVNPNR
jgi:hypothetical protein